ncbi:MAG: diguanylate cyclase and metal dependent phosphohydrolase [Bacillota bacterium]|nr:diguanylate cyclase and metal dependent phosphohydrolase [Bacillota bacterium]
MLHYFKKQWNRITRRHKYQGECIKICLIYFVLGFLWIYFSDRIVYFLAPNDTFMLEVNTYKGWVYVIVTTMILYFLIQSLLKKVEKSEQESLYLSYYDVQTGLYNRRYYETQIQVFDAKENLPVSVIIADVNGLKMINDAFGHQAGDQLLKKAADVIKRICPTIDTIARWGGDEFVIFLPNTSYEQAEALVEQIKAGCCQERVNRVRVSLSLGWDTKTSADMDFSEIMINAENEMYKNKIIQNEGLRGNIINTIVTTLYEKNPREEEHSQRVGEVAEKIGEAIGLSSIEVSKLKVIGHLHDIGKIGIEEGILNKAGKLTDREQDEIRRHPEIGYRILSSSNEMLDLANCVLAHHERWDGLGYPRGLSGEEIPLEARIIALADSYDAMSSERPYRKALNEDVILYEIRKNAGRQFDPVIAKVFVEKVLGKPWDNGK